MFKQFVQDRKYHSSICLHKRNICKNKISGYFFCVLGVTFMWRKENCRPWCRCISYIWQQCTYYSWKTCRDPRFLFLCPKQLLSLTFGRPTEFLPAATIHVVWTQFMCSDSAFLRFATLLWNVHIFYTLGPFWYLFFIHYWHSILLNASNQVRFSTWEMQLQSQLTPSHQHPSYKITLSARQTSHF